MSARDNGSPLWWVRPVIDGVIREDMRKLFAGSLEAVMAHANEMDLKTGLQHSVTAV